MPKSNLIRDRSLQFAVRAVQFGRKISHSKREYVLSRQFVSAATSIGANVEEGIQGQSRKDFISKMSIALKEAFETRYWLRLIHASNLGGKRETLALGKEASELISILASIVKTSRARRKI